MKQPSHSNQNQTKPLKSPKILLIAMGGLVSVMVVVGIFVAIALPSFVKYQCRSKQSEAEANLRTTRVALEAFIAKYNSYPKRFEWSELKPSSANQRYSYELFQKTAAGINAGANQRLGWNDYVINARSIDASLKDDHWRINKRGEVEHVVDGCR